MENNTLYIYIDESGNTGFKINEPYFVICALMLNRGDFNSIKNIVKRTIAEISCYREIEELHANEMSFEEKVEVFNHLNKTKFKISYMVVNKDVIDKSFYKKKNIYFNYMIYLMLHKVLKEGENKEVYITIDNRNIRITAEDSLQEYLNIELIRNKLYNKNISVKYTDSEKNKYLQVVDLFANAVYAKYNFGKNYFYNQIIERIVDITFYPEKFDINNGL